jgi:hypothetical protein
MKTALLVAAVFALWGALAVAAERLFPPNPRRWERMEELLARGDQLRPRDGR